MTCRLAPCVLVASVLSAAAQAQAPFPSRPITMVVPLPAGGTADLLCRLAGEKAGAILGQQIVIENRAGGAGGRIGTETVMRSAPDGYTTLCAPQLNYSITHLVFTKSAFDTRSTEPVSVLAAYPLTLLGRGNLPADDLPGDDADTWMAVGAPAGTPKDVVRKISDAIGQALKTPELRARIRSLEAEPLGNTPEEMREMIRISEEQWGPVVKAAKIAVE